MNDPAGNTNGSSQANGEGSESRGKSILLHHSVLHACRKVGTSHVAANGARTDARNVVCPRAQTCATCGWTLHVNMMLRERGQTQRASHRTMRANVQNTAAHGTGSRVVAAGAGEGRMARECPGRMAVALRAIKVFWNQQRWWWHHGTMNVLHVTEF